MAGLLHILADIHAPDAPNRPHKLPVPYVVPDGYFEVFAATMAAKMALPAMREAVPEGYFEGFAENMVALIRKQEVTAELQETAPFIATLPKQMPHYLPEGYFENLNITIPEKEIRQPAKVVTLKSHVWKKWAAAAAIITALFFTWTYFDKPVAVPNTAGIANDAAIDSLLHDVGPANLSNLLENEATDNGFTSLLLAAQDGVENRVQNLSTEELSAYLVRMGTTEPGS